MEKLNLEKGQKLDLSKTSVVAEDGSLQNIYFGAGWDVNDGGGTAFDLDLIVLAMKGDKVDEAMFFNNKTSQCNGVRLSDDNVTGEGDGDDEFVDIAADCLNPDFTKLVIAVNIFKGSERGQTFGQVNNAYIRIVDPAIAEDDTENDGEFALAELDFDADMSTGFIFGELLKRNDKWYYADVRKSFEGSVQDLVNLYNK